MIHGTLSLTELPKKLKKKKNGWCGVTSKMTSMYGNTITITCDFWTV